MTINHRTIQNYKLYLYESEKSENTIKKYLCDILHFSQWLKCRKLEKSAVLEYKNELCQKYAPRSVNSMLASINSFLEFVGINDAKVKNIKIQAHIFIDSKKGTDQE